MATFKSRTKTEGKSSTAFRSRINPKAYSSLVYNNQNAYDRINDYAKRINNGEWLSADDRAAYKSAIDTYTTSGTALRDVGKSYGATYSAEDDKNWLDSIATMNKGYDEMTGIFSKYSNDDEYQKALKDAEAWQKDYDEKMSYDLEAGKREVDNLNAILGVQDEITRLKADLPAFRLAASKGGYGSDRIRDELAAMESRLKAMEDTWAHAMEVYGSYDALKTLASEKNQYYTLAQRVQDSARLGSVANPESEYYDPNFAKYADLGDDIGYNTTGGTTQQNGITVYDDLKAATLVMNERKLGSEIYKLGMESSQGGIAGWINNTFGNASEYNSENSESIEVFREMTDDEVDTLAYYLAKDKENGTNLAVEYIGGLRDALNARRGERIAAEKDTLASKYLFGAYSGVEQFFEGRDALFSDADFIPTSPTQYASGYIREDLGGKGVPLWYNFKEGEWDNEIFGSSTAQIGYDVINTTSNMLPSVLGSVAANVLAPGYGSYVGTALLGASAAGKAKSEMLNLGYTKDQANAYGAMVGVAEATMEKALGGIPGLKGGGVFSGLAQKIFGKVDNALARAAITVGGNMLDEGLEEGLQTIIEPWLKEAATNVDWDSSTVDEVLYSSLLGALSSVGFSGGEVVSGVKTQINDNAQVKTQYASAVPELISKAIEIGDDNAKKIAEGYQKKIDKGQALSTGEIKKLVNIINSVEEGSAERIAAESKKAVKVRTEDGKTTEIGKVSNIDNGNVTVELKDGTITDAKNVKFENEMAEMVFNTATERVGRVEGWTTETANAMIKAYEEVSTETPDRFIKGWTEAYDLGRVKGASSQLSVMPYARNLPESVRTRAYNIGSVLTETKTVANTKEGSFTFDSSVTPEMQRNFTKKQKADMNALRIVSKALGVNVRVFDSPVNEEGKRVGENGSYDPKTRTIRIDLHAGKGGEGFVAFTAAHELTHHMRAVAKDSFNKFADAVFNALDEGGVNVQELVEARIDSLRKGGRLEGLSESQAYDLAYEEVVADAAERMLADSDAIERLASELKAKDKSLWQRVKSFLENLVKRIKAAYASLNPDSYEGRMLKKVAKNYDELLKIWSDAVVETSRAEDLVTIDTASESVSPLMLSERTWTASEYVTERNEMAEKIAKALGVSVAKAKKYIDDITSIAKMIANDRARLDYEASSFGSAFVSNVEYGGSFDYTTLCKKRRIYTGTFSEIQKRLHDVALTPDDILKIRNLMIEEGIEATCGLCYVEGSRANMGKFAKKFIELYKRDNPDAWIPTMADVNTPDGVEQMRINHPEVYKRYEYFWNHYGKLKDSDPALFASQQKPKLYEARKEYNGEILKHFKGETSIDKKNRNGGIRMQSFSDFEIVHLIDTMQVIMDMSTVGLAGQAYTKVPEFAKAFGNTGLKINLSLIAKGVDADGKLIFDDREGMPHDTAFELRDRYSKNVGTIIVTFTDEQLLAAMADPRIDFIIPFHRSQWKKGQYGAMGLPKGTKDYTFMQNEKLIKQTYHEYQGRMVKDKASNYMPNDYWDFSKSGKENAEAYLKMCAENNKRPKFYKLLDYDGNGTYSLKVDGSTDGYWKLLIDFKMYDNNGVGSPQTQVVPNFNMDEAVKMLDEYKGGHSSYPVANGVVERFISEYNKENRTKYSDRDTSYLDAVNRGDMATAQRMVDEAAKEAGYTVKGLHATNAEFTVFDINKTSSENFHGKGIYFTNSVRDVENNYENYEGPDPWQKIEGRAYELAYDKYGISYEDTLTSDSEIIDKLNECYDIAIDEFKKSGRRITAYLRFDNPLILEKGMQIPNDYAGYDGIVDKQVYENIGHSGMDENTIHYVVFNPNNIKSADPVTYDDNGNVIPLSERFNEAESDIRYSDRDSYAPVFYSHMGRVIDEIKLEKMGTSSILNHLKNRGVKDEEIKWSGIEAFLEGKKSVTKAELQEFVAGSQLQIEERNSADMNTGIELIPDPNTGDLLLYIDGELKDTYFKNVNGEIESRESDDLFADEQMLLDAYEADYGRKRTRWSQHQLHGGKNYREIVFKLPNSSYSNRAMRAHWGEDAKGVLAHARIQDLTVDGKKMLFVEEIQSDWHNEGGKKGYVDKTKEVTVKSTTVKHEDGVYRLYRGEREMYAHISDATLKNRFPNGITEEEIHQGLVDKHNGDLQKAGATPDAPFRNNYHEYVLKRLLRMAAEEGYDSIGWTTADIQSKRWSDQYAEGYRIEYDQDIPKFLRKYGKKWGATVGKTVLEEMFGSTVYTDKSSGMKYSAEELPLKAREIVAKRLGLSVEDTDPNVEVSITGAVYVDAKNDTHIAMEVEQSHGTIVWSMSIPDSMKDSVLYEGQVLYQDRSEDGLSNRTLLANALEGVAQTPMEKQKLAEYKAKIRELNVQSRKLYEINQEIKELTFGKGKKNPDRLKALREEAIKTTNRINFYDKKLLALEATKPLRDVLERETKKAYKEAARKGREALHRNVEGRRKTEARHKIQGVAKELASLLNKGTKERNVKKGERGIVRAALDLSEMLFATDDEIIVNGVGVTYTDAEARAMDEYVRLYEEYHSYDGSVTEHKERRAFLRSQMNDLKQEFEGVIERERKRISEVRSDAIFDALVREYEALRGSDESYIRDAFDKDTLEHIKALQERVGGTLVSEMTLSQLEDVYKALKMVKTMVSKSNKLFKAGKTETVEGMGSAAMSEIESFGHKEKFTKIGKAISKLGWNNLKPIYLMERIGSKTLQRLFQGFLNGESDWAVDMAEARDYVAKQKEKHGYGKWDFKATKEFTSTTGKTFKINLGQMLSLYAYSKRGEQALEHLRTDGFVYDETVEIKGKGGITYELNDKTAYKISDSVLLEILNTLTAEQKAYVDEMIKYLSDTMGAKGNEVSNAMYGIDLFGEENYFPIRSERAYLERAREQAKGEVKIKNKGFTKPTQKGARNAIVLSDFGKVWSEHVAEMSSYHAFTLPMEDFYRVYNYQTKSDENADKRGVIPALHNAFGTASTQAIDQLLTDLNGGARSDPRESVFKRGLSLFKKAKTMLSLSVIVQQPSAILRAKALVDAKYFAGKKIDKRRHKALWEEVKKYAPVAIIKEMGHFDVGMGKSSADWILNEGTWRETLDDLASMPASFMDEVAWVGIWNAVKRETASKNPKMNTSSEEFLKKAGERFEDVIRHTQVYDSTLSRSGNMRSKGVLMQMATAFMAEPTTSINMREAALRSGNAKRILQTTAAVYGSVLFNAVLKAFPYAMRDDDEDETFVEKYVTALGTSFVNDINPLTSLPFVKDVYSMLQGYDVKRSDMGLADDLINSLERFTTAVTEEEKDADKITRAAVNLFGDLAAFTGIPVDNVIRDVRSFINFGKTISRDIDGRDTTWKSLEDALQREFTSDTPLVNWFVDTENKGERLYDALKVGDTRYVARLKATYKDESSYLSAVRKALRDNDPRMREAAVAYLDKDYAIYNALRDEIVKEGVFDRSLVTDALKAEINYLKEKQNNSQ